MAYQALLFCPDEKPARTVTQVLTELEFSVDPCTEPFAAVKKLMSQHFDAIVVDCDNEQNATLLFKSARNSTSNQASLAVAIVEGQAGVAKAFRIGANLVLTKPINVEQSKGTLRVARGLLRKGEPGKPASAATPSPASATSAATAQTAPAPKPLATKPMPAARPASPAATGVRPAGGARPASTLPPRPATPAAAAKTVSVPAPEISPSVNSFAEVTKAETPAPASSPSTPSAIPAKPFSRFSSGAASAPAPARESEPVAPAPATAKLEPATPEAIKPAEVKAPVAQAAQPAVPMFTFGGAATAEPSSGGGKKIAVGLVAAIAMAAVAYTGWNYSQARRSQSVAMTTAPVATTLPKPQPASQPALEPAAPGAAQPHAAPPETPSDTAAVADTHGAATDTDESTVTKPASPAHPAKSSAKASAAAAAPKEMQPAVEVEAPAPLVVKGGSQPHSQPAAAAADAAAPSVIGMAAPDAGGALSNIVAGETSAQPVLQKMKVSQGVAQGLIVKRVAPEYPRAAMTMRIEGAVELAATISKDGEIKDLKVLKGDSQLARAAVQAVKQWKYKPYLLNGEPVEIQTQITVDFKLPE
jgi:periplasmic protein TonB